MRSSTCSTTCTAAVRPKRASSARGSASALLMVPVALSSSRMSRRSYSRSLYGSTSCASVIWATTVSPSSSTSSSISETFIFLVVSPGTKTNQPATLR